jgi:hypothetical protein
MCGLTRNAHQNGVHSRMASQHPVERAESPRLLLVTGSGRSGTSTVSGALTRLGYHVPLPEVAANASNPRGFYEPRWVVELHKRLLREAAIRDLDARPEARARAAQVVARPEVRAEVRSWLEPELVRKLVVKDPRTVWFIDLWLETADALGAHPASVTMLRHPAEVVGSRDVHYSKNLSGEQRRQREVANVAGWINVALVNERLTRGVDRAFLRYTDLIAGWRGPMHLLSEQLRLGLDLDETAEGVRAVDDFIDVGLHRTRLTWDDLDVPPYLRDLAEAVWDNLAALADGSRSSAELSAGMDGLRSEYDVAYSHAVAFARDHIESTVRAARRRAQRLQRRAENAEREAADGGGRNLPHRFAATVRQMLNRQR